MHPELLHNGLLPRVKMPKELLSDTTLRALKAHATSHNGKKRLDDGGGLYLLMCVKGTGRAWRFDYTIGGKRKTISLGTYPETTLALARTKAVAARAEVAGGIDPSETRKKLKATQQNKIASEKRELAGLPSAYSFEYVAQEWYGKCMVGKSESHTSRAAAFLRRDLNPWIGRLPIADIEAPVLLECLRKVEARDAKESANRLRAMAGSIWRYAIATGRAKRDIAADLRGSLSQHVSKNFSHITDPKQLGQLLRDIDSYTGTPMVKAALRILPLVFTRPGEFRAAKWSEIDLETKEWRYVATKTNANHIVALSTQVVQYLEEVKALTGNGKYVFGVRAGARPLSDGTLNQALKSMGYSTDVIQPHGFRHTAATMLAEIGWNTEAIDRQLAHKPSGTKGVYQKAQYLEERRRMMQAWADHTDALRTGAQIFQSKPNSSTE